MRDFLLFLILLNVTLALVVVDEQANSTNVSAMATTSRVNLVQKRFNLFKKKMEKLKAKKSLAARQFSSGGKNSTTEYDPILKKPTSFAKSASSTLLNSNNKLLTTSSSSFLMQANASNISNQCWLTPCLNGASCYGSDSSYYCYCKSGFTGINCETKVKLNKVCHSKSCSGRGTCIRLDETGYKCKCFQPYYGVDCENEKR
jgi:hypothetical protein